MGAFNTEDNIDVTIGLSDDEDELTLDMSDEDLEKLLKQYITKGESERGKNKTRFENNMKYYTGDYDDEYSEELTKYKTRDNRLFTDLETVVPLASAKPAKPVVFTYNRTSEEFKIMTSLEKVLLDIYRKQGMRKKVEKVVRHNQLAKFGIFKYGIKDGKIFTDFVLPSKFIIDPDATCIEDADFCGEIIELKASELKERFKDKEEIINEISKDKDGVKIKLYEIRTDDYKCLVTADGYKIISKMKNPHYDWGSYKESYDDFGKVIKNDITKNYFKSPRKPYVLVNVYNLGDSYKDSTTPFILAKTLQENIDRRKTQIHINAESVANPIKLGKGINADQMTNFVNAEVGDGIIVPGDGSVSYLAGQNLGSDVFNDLQDSRNAIDNLFGTHSTTRGERQGQETAQGRELLRGGDEDRQSTIGSSIEEALRGVYEGWLQLIAVHYREEEFLPVLGKEGAGELVKLSRDDVNEGLEVYIRPGSTLPDDKISRMTVAFRLAERGLITRERLFEELGMDDPKGLSESVIKQQVADQDLAVQEQRKKAQVQAEVQNAGAEFNALGEIVGNIQ